MAPRTAAPVKLAPTRRAALLDAALTVYARYGYRKASMDEIARAAGVSRQGLYLQFANKDDLFRASVDHYYARTLNAALTALADKEQSIDRRLIVCAGGRDGTSTRADAPCHGTGNQGGRRVAGDVR